jgi:hypothetical protein
LMERLLMSTRRRRRKLSSLMSRMEQRVRAVELRPINLLTSGQVEDLLTVGDAASGPATIVSSTAPWQFRRVHDGYVYPKALTKLSSDRVELYLEADLGAAAGDRLEVSGIHWASSTAIDVTSDNFTVEAVDTPPWDDRPSYRHDPTEDQLSGTTISHAYYFQPETVAPSSWTGRRRLQTRRKVDTFSVVGTTVTLTMNAVHHFEVGDVIFVDIFAEDSRAYGSDGLFRVTEVTSSTITYELSAGVDTPTGTVTPGDDVYVFPVAREWAQVNSIWVDSTTDKTYYWDGIRWVDYTNDVAIPGDGDPPLPPTNFEVTSELNFFGGNYRISVTATWTAPTQTVGGAELTDLLKYVIQWRAGSGAQWIPQSIDSPTATSVTIESVGTFIPNTAYDFELYAQDSGNLKSTPATDSITTEDEPATNITTVRPTAFSNAVPYLGTVTLTWPGTVENALGASQPLPDGLIYLDIYRGLGDTFATATQLSTISAVAGNKYVDAALSENYGTEFYYFAVLRDAYGSSSLPSLPVSVTAKSSVDAAAIAGIIDAAEIVPGSMVTGESIVGLSITGQLIQGLEIHGDFIKANTLQADRIIAGSIASKLLTSDVISTSATDSGSRVRLTTAGLEAYNGGTRTFFLDSTNGAVTIGGYATSDQLGTVSNTAADAYTLADVANTAATTATGNAANAIQDISTLEGQVYFPGTTEINGGNIRTGTIVANAIGAGTLVAGVVYAGNVSATQITAGTITGRSLQTADTGRRVVVSSSTDNIRLYDEDGDICGIIRGNGTSLSLGYATSSDLYGVAASGGAATFYSGGVELRGDNQPSPAYLKLTSGTTTDYAQVNRLRVDSLDLGSIYSVYSTATGNLYGGVVISSDARLKDNIENITLGEAFVNDLRPVDFDWVVDEDGTLGRQYGLIAQELKSTLSDYGIVSPNGLISEQPESPDENDPYLSIEYQMLVPVLIKASQELSQKVSDLENRIATLEGN